jgi:hypothetical protein
MQRVHENSFSSSRVSSCFQTHKTNLIEASEAAMHWTETRMGVTEEGAAENSDLGEGSPIRKRSLKDREANRNTILRSKRH